MAKSTAEPTVGRPWTVRTAQAIARVRADIWFAIIEAGLIVIAYSAALSIRFADTAGVPPTAWWSGLAKALPVIILVHLAANLLFGAYGHVWRYASIGEALRVVGASVSAAMVLLIGLLLFREVFGGEGLIPVSVLVIGAMFTLVGMGAIRFWSRVFSLRRMNSDGLLPHRTLVVGTGNPAVHLARSGLGFEHPIEVVGFVDPVGSHSPRRLASLPVLGSLDDVVDLVDRYDIDQIVIAHQGAHEIALLLVDRCMHVNVSLRILPNLGEAMNGNGGTRDVRDLELTDLLPRPPVQSDLRLVALMIRGRRVMVTGAGGSVGAEIVRQILEFEPATLTVLDNDETHLYEGVLGWSDEGGALRTELADIRDHERVMRVFAEHRPQVIFHAAAHKHVPVLETSPEEAVKTNVVGTDNLLEASRLHGVEHFVLISTDKAVDPSSVMGASKRVAEMMVQAEAETRPTGTYAAVRFGNVLGSRGSVVPTFVRQIKQGGPVTVSDPKMERYFMTVDEAVQLVLQAAAMAEAGEVFILDMGQQVRVIDLAHRLIRLSGLVPDQDIEVRITGARPGEKMQEVLSTSPLEPSSNPKIRIARPDYPGAVTLMDAISTLAKLSNEGDREGIREMLLAMTHDRWETEEYVNLLDVVDTSFVGPVLEEYQQPG